MAALTSYSTGTISIGAGATSVVGVGSIWTGGNVFAGDTLVVAGHEVTVLDVVDATHLTIEAWPYSAVTAGSSYKTYKNSPLRVTNAQIATQTASIFSALATDGYFYYVDSTETVPDPSLGDDGQYALKPTTGEVWLKTGGIWVASAFNIVTSGVMNFSNTTEATGVGTTFGARFAGGVEIAKKLFVGGAITLAAYWATVRANCYYDGAWKYLGNGLAWGMGNNFNGGSSATTIAVAATNASGANAALSWNPVLDIAPTQVKVIPNTASSSTTTGALIVGGGVGVGGSIYAAGVIVGVGIYAAGAMKCSHPTGGLGYDTGAGGTVTQATSKSTGVSLSKVSGQITMNAAALAAATIVSFVLTNTAIAATDTLVINHVSGGTPGAYGFNAQCAAGSATINVRNNTAGSLSEAIVLQFNLIKGVTS